VDLFTVISRRAEHVEEVPRLQPSHFRWKRDTPSCDWTTGRAVAYKDASDHGANRRKEKNHGIEEESNQEVEEGQGLDAHEATLLEF
jgi:hypothetical protein